MEAHGLFTEKQINKHAERHQCHNWYCHTIGNLYKVVRHHVDKDNKYNIYFAYTYSNMLYSINVYECACNEHLKRLQV